MVVSRSATKYLLRIMRLLVVSNISNGNVGELVGRLVSFSGRVGNRVGSVGDSNFNFNSSSDSLDTWEPPGLMKRYFPYYLSGLDFQGRPVWVIEFGKWNIQKYFAEGGDPSAVDLYTDQMFARWANVDKYHSNDTATNANGTTIDEPGRGFGLIVDFDGYSITEITSPKALRLALKMTVKFMNVAGSKMAYGNLININKVANTFVNVFLRPILAQIFLRMETSGTNRNEWTPRLLRRIPASSLPSWYGGSEDFTAIANYG